MVVSDSPYRAEVIAGWSTPRTANTPLEAFGLSSLCRGIFAKIFSSDFRQFEVRLLGVATSLRQESYNLGPYTTDMPISAT